MFLSNNFLFFPFGSIRRGTKTARLILSAVLFLDFCMVQAPRHPQTTEFISRSWFVSLKCSEFILVATHTIKIDKSERLVQRVPVSPDGFARNEWRLVKPEDPRRITTRFYTCLTRSNTGPTIVTVSRDGDCVVRVHGKEVSLHSAYPIEGSRIIRSLKLQEPLASQLKFVKLSPSNLASDDVGTRIKTDDEGPLDLALHQRLLCATGNRISVWQLNSRMVCRY